jgi:hypothetical protein
MSRVFTYNILNRIKNAQLIEIKRGVIINQELSWGFFNVRDPEFENKVIDFLGNGRHKKIILGVFDYNSGILPISFLMY